MRNSIKLIPRMLPVGILCLALNLIAASAQTMSGGNYKITSSVHASGGGTSSGSGNKVIEGTAGQTAAGGPTFGSALSHDAGFWPTTLTQAAATPTPSPTPTPAPLPGISINDLAVAEGNTGITNFSFNVTLSSTSKQTISVDYATSPGTAALGEDYQPASDTLVFAPGETVKAVTVLVNGDTQVEPNETFFLNLSNPVNAAIQKTQGTGTIINDDQVSGPTIQFSQATYAVQEELGAVTLTITRAGSATLPASVDYVTNDGSATQKADFEIAIGTLTFAPGETSKTITVLLNEDACIEGSEIFSLSLGNPAGATLGQQSTAMVTMMDDLPETPAHPIDDPQAFVYTHYHDFLNREPDADGLAFWTNQITSCGNDLKCVEERRINVSASFFLSIEFQQTAYLRYLVQKESFDSLPKYAEFMRDVQEVSRGVIVNAPGWEQKIKDNQRQFAENWVSRPAFKAIYDGMSNPDFVQALYANAGILAPQAKIESLVNALATNNQSRAEVLLEVAADGAFRQKEHSAAFVLMQYFGYLRRDAAASPDSDLSGYNFWLNKLNQFGGNYVDAEMIKAFITSFEYRGRFGQ